MYLEVECRRRTPGRCARPSCRSPSTSTACPGRSATRVERHRSRRTTRLATPSPGRAARRSDVAGTDTAGAVSVRDEDRVRAPGGLPPEDGSSAMYCDTRPNAGRVRDARPARCRARGRSGAAPACRCGCSRGAGCRHVVLARDATGRSVSSSRRGTSGFHGRPPGRESGHRRERVSIPRARCARCGAELRHGGLPHPSDRRTMPGTEHHTAPGHEARRLTRSCDRSHSAAPRRNRPVRVGWPSAGSLKRSRIQASAGPVAEPRPGLDIRRRRGRRRTPSGSSLARGVVALDHANRRGYAVPPPYDQRRPGRSGCSGDGVCRDGPHVRGRGAHEQPVVSDQRRGPSRGARRPRRATGAAAPYLVRLAGRDRPRYRQAAGCRVRPCPEANVAGRAPVSADPQASPERVPMPSSARPRIARPRHCDLPAASTTPRRPRSRHRSR